MFIPNVVLIFPIFKMCQSLNLMGNIWSIIITQTASGLPFLVIQMCIRDRDMMQNHLFQILTIVAMEQPKSQAVEDMHREQMKVLEALSLPENISESMVLGQYDGYRKEPSVRADSSTETYAAVRLFVDNDRWRGMPFYIRTGKKLDKREMQVAVVFKSPAPDIEPDILNIKIQPTEGVYLQFNIKKPGESVDVIQAKMDFCPVSYTHLS